MQDDQTLMNKVRERKEKDEAKRQFIEMMEKYNQDADANFDGIELRGRHFIIKAPKIETESGLILTEETRKTIQAVTDSPTFKEEFKVELASKQCDFIEAGQLVLLSPHVQTLEIALPTPEGEEVLYLMIHEDYVLATKEVD